jgi:hypothetical protein
MRNSHGFLIPSRWGGIGIPLIGAFSLLIGANQAFVQVTTNTYDTAADPAYSGGTDGGQHR